MRLGRSGSPLVLLAAEGEERVLVLLAAEGEERVPVLLEE
jgi:hypothetical protein